MLKTRNSRGVLSYLILVIVVDKLYNLSSKNVEIKNYANNIVISAKNKFE